jgi:Holliday junction resolvase-like predicted endonuclease
VDATFRPLLKKDDMLFILPAPMAAQAIVNAAMHWCDDTWSKGNSAKGNFDRDVVGPLFENFIRDKLTQHGVSVLHGNYKAGRSEGQCDAIVDTEKSVIVFELKSKVFRRQSRSGDDVAALADLAQALVRSQAQAMERHAVLQEHKTMTLTNGTPPDIALGSREVLKLSIARGDLGSLHDRLFLQLFLRTGCAEEFRTTDPNRQDELDGLHKWFGKLKAAAARAGEAISSTPDTQFPFSTSWSLSVFQLLLLLERTNDNESFSKELQRTRRIFMSCRDFYQEYAYALSFGSQAAHPKPHT